MQQFESYFLNNYILENAKNRQYSLCTTSSVSDSNDTDFKEKITL